MSFNQQKLGTSNSFTVTGGTVKVGDRKAGYIKCLQDGRLAFITPRKYKQHFFRMYQGYGLNSDLIQYLREHKIMHVLIIEDRKRMLLSKTEDWMFRAFNYNHPNYEPQKILHLRFMEEVKDCI